MFPTVLIANRGEIAVRIIRTLKRLGIRTVAVYSDADRDAKHVRDADDAVAIGPPQAAKSYLKAEAIIQAAAHTGATAVHPGYGFLSENARFAAACESAGLTFIGPTPENIAATGNKLAARQALSAVGIPTIPGSEGALDDLARARACAARLGYPVMLKAAAGGGGRGLRAVNTPDELDEAFFMAQGEARAAFGDASLYMEKRVVGARHIEVQVLGDGQGGAVHLGERNCSVQRRHQKLFEEAPSPALPPEVAAGLHAAATHAVAALRYRNAGTVEFLVDADGRFYFLEVNARIQVEHPVTEAITARDIVEAQLSIAATGALPFAQHDVSFGGHAIECRLNAEDPDQQFMPQPGRIEHLRWPAGPDIRIDTHVFEGYDVPIYYDSLLAKLIVTGASRSAALATLRRALAHTAISPINTTTTFFPRLLEEPSFLDGTYDLSIVPRLVPELEEESV